MESARLDVSLRPSEFQCAGRLEHEASTVQI